MTPKKIMVAVMIFLATIFSVSHVHAQTTNLESSNDVVQPNSTLAFGGFSNQTTVNSTSPSSNVDQSCISKMIDAAHSKARTMDNAKAISMATTQSEFKLETLGYALPYSSIFNTWKLDTTNCTVSWNDVNVAYQLYNGTRYVKTVVVTLDPALTQVTKIDEQVAPSFVTPTSNAIWSGYDLAGSNTMPLPTVLRSSVIYTLPVASASTEFLYPCNIQMNTYQPCDASIWTGLEDQVGASDGNLVQAGTDEEICAPNACIPQYYLWYEFYPSAATTCGGQVAPGDSINSTVTNEGGVNNNKYDISVVDSTSLNMCTVTGQTYNSLTSPTYAAFIHERAQETSNMLGYPATLANFTAYTITGTMDYGVGRHQISSNVLGAQWQMNNQGHDNISLGSISSGSFTQTWLTSLGTQSTCVPPRTGDLTISASCTVPNNATAQGNVIVQSGGNLLTIPSGVTLTIPFATNHLLVNDPSHSSVLIKAGGKISS